MKKSSAKHENHTAHQTVTEEFINVPTGSESIRIGFTDQKISGRAGISTFSAFMGWHRFGDLLCKLLPDRQGEGEGGTRRQARATLP